MRVSVISLWPEAEMLNTKMHLIREKYNIKLINQAKNTNTMNVKFKCGLLFFKLNNYY